MVIQEVIKSLNDNERVLYEAQTASEYFRFLYYSSSFINILKKLNNKEKLNDREWDYLIKRLFLVTCKAIDEEDSINVVDRITYILNKIGVKVFKEDGHIYNECMKMVEFIESIYMEQEINEDLLLGLDKIETERNETELDILLKQHREASVFRDNKDAFYTEYNNSKKGVISDSESAYMDSMDRSYIREKELVKRYKK